MLDLNSVFTVKYFLNSFKFYKNLSKCFNATFLFQNYFWLFTIGTVVLILTQKVGCSKFESKSGIKNSVILVHLSC